MKHRLKTRKRPLTGIPCVSDVTTRKTIFMQRTEYFTMLFKISIITLKFKLYGELNYVRRFSKGICKSETCKLQIYSQSHFDNLRVGRCIYFEVVTSQRTFSLKVRCDVTTVICWHYEIKVYNSFKAHYLVSHCVQSCSYVNL